MLPIFDFIDSTLFIEKMTGRRPAEYLARDIMEVTLKYGFDGLHPVHRTANMSIRGVREKYSDKLCLIGNVDSSHTLVYGSEEEIICIMVDLFLAPPQPRLA